MKTSMSKTWSIRMLILFSIIILCGAASLTSALSPPNRFSGDVTLNGAPAPVGTVIEAYIDGEFRGTTTVEVAGVYKRLPVNGDSPDDGKPITFTVNGLTADQTGTTWMAMVDHVRPLDLTASDTSAGDITPPEITIASPSSGDTFVTATITVSGTASDDEGVGKVEVRVGSGDWVTATGTTSWSATVTLDMGPNTIHARANDASGNSGEVYTDNVSYVVEGSEDTTPPSVSITSPSPGDAFETASTTVSGTASDDEGVGKVEVRVGSGDWVTATGTTSWSATVTMSKGLNTIDVRAVDTTGNPSETMSVIVAYNPPGTTSSGSTSGGSTGEFAAAPGTTPATGEVTQPISGETVTPATSTTPATSATPAATSAKGSGAEPEEKNGKVPGFEAMFAITGLLAVVYLIRRMR